MLTRQRTVKPLKQLWPHPGYYEPDQVRHREEIIAITKRDAEWKCEGFVNMVVRIGFRAIAPPEKKGGAPRSWQEVGRKLFGEEMFNRHLKAAIERKHAGQPGSPPVK